MQQPDGTPYNEMRTTAAVEKHVISSVSSGSKHKYKPFEATSTISRLRSFQNTTATVDEGARDGNGNEHKAEGAANRQLLSA